MPYNVKKPRSRKRLFAASAAGLLVVIIVVLYATNHLPFFHLFHRDTKATPVVTASSETKGEKTTANTSTKQKSSSSVPVTGENKNPASDSTATLLAPTGTFVNTHSVSLDSDNGMTSNCTTTPGATCKISFTKDGVTKSLPDTTTDAGGTAYWDNWKLKNVGLTKGSWAITATVKLGSKTQIANDAMNLEVTE